MMLAAPAATTAEHHPQHMVGAAAAVGAAAVRMQSIVVDLLTPTLAESVVARAPDPGIAGLAPLHPAVVGEVTPPPSRRTTSSVGRRN